MFTKEVENIAKSLPEFIEMTTHIQNPLLPGPKYGVGDKEPEPLESVAKALWFVIPFHLLAFFGLVDQSAREGFPSVILVGLLSIVGLMWVGSLLSLVPADHRNSRSLRAGYWVASIVSTWFYTVLFLAIANTVGWLQEIRHTGRPWYEVPWPDITGTFQNWVAAWPVLPSSSTTLQLSASIFGVLGLTLTSWNSIVTDLSADGIPQANPVLKACVFLLTCGFSSYAMIVFSLFLADNALW